MRLGVDFSQYGGPLDTATIECWKQQGVSHAVVQYSALMPQHLQILHQQNGIEIEGYVYLYWETSPWGQTPEQRTQLAIDMARANGGITRLWLDAEDETKPFTPDQLERCIAVCTQNSMPCGIYTGKWWWDAHAKGITRFSDLPLWDAYYLATSPLPNMNVKPGDMSGFRPYGGWTKPVIWQWHNTTSLCGHDVDLNVLEDITPQPQPQPQPETPTEEGEIYDMLSWHSWATWFTNRRIAGSNNIYVMQARTDWSLPAEAKAVMFNVPITDPNSDKPQFFHGGTNIPVGELGPNTYIGNLADNGTLNFRCLNDVQFSDVHCIGYYR